MLIVAVTYCMFSGMSTGKTANLRSARQIFPLAVMAEGRKCLVVGAGKTGCRKVAALVEAGADVTVVAPTAADSLNDLLGEHKVRWLRRRFKETDADETFLVFAATDAPATNSMVLAACRRRGVLCGIVDKGWQEGDFISPAVHRQDGLTIAVSTGGRSCRRSRMVKQSLARHVDAVGRADLLVMGTSHQQLPLDRRAALHIGDGRASEIAAMLTEVWGVHEFALLNTCNRTELHAVVSERRETGKLLRLILGLDGLGAEESYALTGLDAFRHSSLLLAGLLSQTPGENHIVAQVKQAFRTAEEAGWANSMMREWLSSSLHVSKAIRQSTRPLLHPAEVEDLCLDYLAAQDQEPAGRGLVVLGTGMIGRGIVERFLKRYPAAPVLWSYHRMKPQIRQVWRNRIRLVRLDAIRSQLGDVRAIVCATSGPDHVLRAKDASCFQRTGTVHIVDLGLPRNVAPDLDGNGSNIHVADLDDLKHWYRREAADMTDVLDKANAIVDGHGDMYAKLVRGLRER